ncbi:hypothetical protein [Micromonospora echinofusca]
MPDRPAARGGYACFIDRDWLRGTSTTAVWSARHQDCDQTHL